MFSEGNHVWIENGIKGGLRHPESLSDCQIREEKNQVEDDDGKVEWTTQNKILKSVQASIIDPVDDMIHLSDLEECVILRNLHIRYKNHQIYTYIGDILIAVNPYQMLDIYSTREVLMYSERKSTTLPPHIFATSDKCFRNMKSTKRDQCIIISGESGAGKTESTKLILQYLTARSAGGHSWIKQQILDANSILEAFGNAKTQCNENSSRFGKYINVYFNSVGEIEGARIDYYLLEKSRIVTHLKNERNYHIFYAILTGLSHDEKQKLHLGSVLDYKYLHGVALCKGRNDSKTFANVKAAMQVLNYNETTFTNVIRLLVMILHLGNLKYKSTTINHTDVTEIHDDVTLKRLCDFLEVDQTNLTNVLTKKTIYAKKEQVVSNLTKDQAREVRDAFAKLIYEKIFENILREINNTIQNTKSRSKNTIGILDISGFENFDINSFEQLCINYANESLQQFFVQNIFKIEQESYTSESISWIKINFVDNQEIIEMIGTKPLNIMSLIDEESIFPKGSDSSMLSKISLIHGVNTSFVKLQSDSMNEFGIVHYAGPVTYNVVGFLNKNRDIFSTDIKQLINTSTNTFLKNLFANDELVINGDSNKRSATVSMKFRSSLDSLLSTLRSCNPFFIRCIKPNGNQLPEVFDRTLCTRQLRYSGLADTAKIRRAGYSLRYEYTEFSTLFRALTQGIDPTRMADKRFVTEQICKKVLGKNDFCLGHTKVFLKDYHGEILEKKKKEVLERYANIVQRNLRMWVYRKRFLKIRKAVIILQKVWKGYGPRYRYLKIQHGILRLQSRIRSRYHEVKFQQQRRIVISLQAVCRRYIVKKICAEKRKQILENKKLITLHNKVTNVQLSSDKNDPKQSNNDDNIDSIFDFLDKGRKSSISKKTSSKLFNDMLRNELAITGSLRGTDELCDKDLISYDFHKFAAIYFVANASSHFSKKPLNRSLLDLPRLSDQLAAKALSITILRFMGDLLEPDNYVESYSKKSAMNTVSETLTKNYSKSIENDNQHFLRLTLKKKNKLNNIIAKGIVYNEYENWLNVPRSNLEKLNFIIGHGILRPELKDEIYSQIIKQLIRNPSKVSSTKGWILISLCLGCFAPSERLIMYLKSFIRRGPVEFAYFCEKRLMRTFRNGTRTQPPCWIEMQSVKYKEAITLQVELMDSSLRSVKADSASISQEIVESLSRALGIRDIFGFSLFIIIDDKFMSLGAEKQHVMDAISQCEQYAVEKGYIQRDAKWRLIFKKEIFSPWYNPTFDKIATDLIYDQICWGLKLGEYRCQNEHDLVMLIARQLYVYSGNGLLPQPFKHVLHMFIPNYMLQKNSVQNLLRLDKLTLYAYRKEFLANVKVDGNEVKQKIIEFAKNEWTLLFSKFYEAKKIFGPEFSQTNVMIGVNSMGIYFFDNKERILHKLNFYEIYEVNYQKHEDALFNSLTISTIQREEFIFQSLEAESFVSLVNFILDSLKIKSEYVVAIQDYIDDEDSGTHLSLRKGDIIKLVDGCNGHTVLTCSYVIGEKNGVRGKFPCECVYVLQTIIKPSLKSMEIFKGNFTSESITRTKFDLNQSLKVSREHNLKKFADEHFKPIMSKAEKLWKHTREPIKIPLMKKISDDEEKSQQAVLMFRNVMKYMGDLPSNKQIRIGTEHTDSIFGTALTDGLLRDELFCQIMRQLTDNKIRLSEERGWELMWLATGAMPCSPLVRKELEQFLNSRESIVAKDCLTKLNKVVNSGTVRIYPPCMIEVEAIRFKRLHIFQKIYFPDSTDADFEIHSSTRAQDICEEIARKLQLHSVECFYLYFKISDRIISMPMYYFFFDFIREVIDWITRLNSAHPSTPLDTKYQVLFMKKIWIDCLPGRDKNADSKFHYYQESTKYLRGYHKCSKKDAVKLAALIYISTHGDNKDDLSQMHLKLQEYIPIDMIGMISPKAWRKRIVAAHSHYKGLTQDDAKERFLQQVYQWPTFGSAFFDVRQTMETRFPELITLAINKNGVSIIHPLTKEILALYGFSDITNWSSDDTYFHMTIGGFINGCKLLCETTLGYKMDDLISSYIDFLQGNDGKTQKSQSSIVQ
ncbi:myosin-VIIa-like [Phymastichus coffea]|uniref:myosin-VIIa-like n=1 Tax=Phymastichus coffea TaxID=108790 RepID=UPI00273C7A66|nr:myosin-VIIa-like [Phymastichus coffea]